METAIVFNNQSGFSKEMTATEYERLYLGNKDLDLRAEYPDEAQNLEAVSPHDALPLHIRKSYYRQGHETLVHACWVRPDGHGDHNHIFDREAENLQNALESGKKVLLSLNMNLTSRPVSFKNLQENGAKNLDDWVAGNRGQYISVAVHSAQEAINAIKKVNPHNTSRAIDDQLFALHEGAVVPYRNFYLGNRKADISSLYNNMQNKRSGMPVGETRVMGFPRLFRFVPTDTTLKENGARGLKGSCVKSKTGKPLFNRLIFSNNDEALASDPYKILSSEILSEKGGVYVLASPSIKIEKNQDTWKMMRWTINDIETQTTSLSKEGKEILNKPEKLDM